VQAEPDDIAHNMFGQSKTKILSYNNGMRSLLKKGMANQE